MALPIQVDQKGVEAIQNGQVEGFINIDYAINPDNRKSISSYVFTVGGEEISWMSKLPECMVLSTTEAEYITTSEVAKGAIWLQRLSADILVKSRINHPAPTLYYDSQSKIHLTQNPVYHSKKKHIEVRYHHIGELITDKKLEVRKVD